MDTAFHLLDPFQQDLTELVAELQPRGTHMVGQDSDHALPQSTAKLDAGLSHQPLHP